MQLRKCIINHSQDQILRTQAGKLLDIRQYSSSIRGGQENLHPQNSDRYPENNDQIHNMEVKDFMLKDTL
jgi:hypothetical protein